MFNLEFVESSEEQEQKRYADEDRAAAVCLWLTEPWHDQIPLILIADAWFGGVPTAVGLMRREWYCITNVKTHTKHFCKKQLWAEALGNKRKHECNERAYRELILNIDGKVTTLSAAFHMDKAPMTLLGTAGSSKQAPPVMRRRVYMIQGADLVRWTGELKQPDICCLYRSNFNVVDVHNKLAAGPRSVCNVASSSLPLKLFLYLIACAETSGYLMYMHFHKLSAETYNHSDFK
jgi:hypothetical protein